MENLILLLFDACLCSSYLLLCLFIICLMQIISYRVFNFNLYKWALSKLLRG